MKNQNVDKTLKSFSPSLSCMFGCCAKKTSAKETISKEDVDILIAQETMATNGHVEGPAPKYTIDQQAALDAVVAMFGTWGAGKLKTDLKPGEWWVNRLQLARAPAAEHAPTTAASAVVWWPCSAPGARAS